MTRNPWSRRLAAAVLLVLASLTLSFGAAAQAPPPPAPAPVTADELQRLVDTLQNDQDRAHLVEQLRALIAVQRGQAAPETPPPTFIGALSQQLNAISDELLTTAAVLVDAPRLLGWLRDQVSDSDSRARWLEVLTHLAIVFGVAIAAEWVVRWLLARPRAVLANRSSGHLFVRLVLNLLRALIGVLPIIAFAAAAYTVLPLTQPRVGTARVAEVIIRASVLARIILVVVRAALLSSHSVAALSGLEEESRNYLYIWVRRFTNSAVYGYGIVEAAWWLGVPGGVYAVLLKTVALVLAVLAIIFVLQNRRPVGVWLRGKSVPSDAPPPPDSGWRILRTRLAEIWHVLVIVYIAGLYVVYALRIEGGFGFVLRATVLSVVLLVVSRLLVRVILKLTERGFAVSPDLKARFPTLEARANRYVPVVSGVVSAIVYVFTALALLQAWGLDAFAWFDSELGRRVTGAVVSIAVVLVVALVAWELFSSAIERYLANLGNGTRSSTRAARARTLLPLLRTIMLGVIVVLVTLIVLSEIGVNIAPLLAGAGVVGLAIGFGSQSLVKDVITGLFMLIEDTFAVGDVIDLGGGHSGTVEALSVRTIRLRDMAGAIHTIPFSEVHTVKNLTRDFSYFVADVGVVYREDPDHAIDVLNQVGQELAEDPNIAPSILEPLEVVGVDRFSDTAMVIKVRIKVWPFRQWAVGREFNRRMKKAFDQNGIEMPAANQTHYLSDPPAKDGSAPAAAPTQARDAIPDEPPAEPTPSDAA